MSPFAQSFKTTLIRSKQVADRLGRSLPLVNMILSLLAVILVIGYIIQVNSAVTKGYDIRALETTIEQLTLENQQMDVELRKVRSLNHVARNVKMLRFEPAGTAVYVSAGGPAFALAE